MLDITKIKKIIPHRYPMLLIDRVEELIPGEKAVAKRNVTINEELSQTGAVALLSLPEFKGKTAYFGGIKSAKFRKVVRPGDSLRLEVTLEKIRNNVGLGKAIATVDGKKACTAELTFMIG